MCTISHINDINKTCDLKYINIMGFNRIWLKCGHTLLKSMVFLKHSHNFQQINHYQIYELNELKLTSLLIRFYILYLHSSKTANCFPSFNILFNSFSSITLSYYYQGIYHTQSFEEALYIMV